MILWRRLKYLLPWHRRAVNREIQEELNSLAALAEPGELSNLTLAAEDARAVWGWVWLERLWQDLRYGGRLLAKNPGFTAVAVVSLGVGVGANCAMFSFADGLLLRPLPVPRPSEVVTVGSTTSNEPSDTLTASYQDYLDIRDRSQSFDGLTAFTSVTAGFASSVRHTAAYAAGQAGDRQFLQGPGSETRTRARLPERRGSGSRKGRRRHSESRLLGTGVRRPTLPCSGSQPVSVKSSSPSLASRRRGLQAWIQAWSIVRHSICR